MWGLFRSSEDFKGADFNRFGEEGAEGASEEKEGLVKRIRGWEQRA